MQQVIINPDINIAYSSFYIEGLKNVYGKKNVSFARKSQLEYFNNAGNSNFTFIVDTNFAEARHFKAAIDFYDSNSVSDVKSYNWCDVYGKINYNSEVTPAHEFPKIKCLASNFGIRCFGYFESLRYALTNYLKVKPVNKKKYFAGYFKQNKKTWLKRYPFTNAEKNYIFSVHTLWLNDVYNRLNETTNKFRADFMEICRQLPQIKFEGGFVPSCNGIDNYGKLHLKSYISHGRYLKKLQKSVVAFNTPAVWRCHGWKLSEYLYMGKAIISTPLINDLPAPLVHGESIHFVKDNVELKDAIIQINDNKEYRRKLETGAREYYDKYVSPEAAIRILIS